MTPQPAPSTAQRPAADAYAEHVARCNATAFGRWCFTCLQMVRDADAEDWSRAREREKGSGRR